MVQVPYRPFPTETPEKFALPTQRFDVNSDMFGAGVGRATARLGGVISQVGETLSAAFQQQKNEADAAAAKDAYLNASVAKAQVDTGFYSLEGKNAVDAYPKYVEDLQKIRQDALDSLKGSPKAQKMFDTDFTNDAVNALGSGGRHVATQTKVYKSGQSAARVDLAMKDPANVADNDRFRQNLGVVNGELDQQAQIEGWSPEMLSSKKATFTSKAWMVKLSETARNDPFEAMKLYSANADALTAEDQVAIEGRIQQQMMTVGVHQGADMVSNGVNTVTPRFAGAMTEGGMPAYTAARKGGVAGSLIFPVGGSQAGKTWHDVPSSGGAPGSRDFGGNRHGLFHTAVDIPATLGDPVLGVMDGGVVVRADASRNGYGNVVDVQYPDGTVHRMAHLDQINVKVGEPVAQGQQLGTAGSSGNADAGFVHVHYEVIKGDAYKAMGGRPPGREVSLASLNNDRLDPRGYFGGAGAGARAFVPQGNLQQRIIGADSAGVSGLVSPKGALGIMQVMPETARIVASQLGIPFSLSRLQYDVEYNTLIGTTYLSWLLKQFGGNETLAAAAYNAGPGRVVEWIAKYGDPSKGQISNEEWASKIPFAETRNYVAKIMGGAGVQPSRVTIGPTSSAGDLASGLDYAKQIADTFAPGNAAFLDALQSKVRGDYELSKSVRADQMSAAYDAVLNEVISEPGKTPPTDLRQLSQEAQDYYHSLPPTQRKAIDTQLEQNASPSDKAATPQMSNNYDRLLGLRETNPEAFKAYDFGNDPNLTPALRKQLIDLKHKPLAAEKGPNYKQMLDIAAPLLQGAGITKKDTIDKYNQFVGAFLRVSDEQSATLKRPLKPEEVRQITSDLLEKTVVSGWFGQTQHYKFESYGIDAEGLSTVPPRDFGASFAPNRAFTVPDDVRQTIIDRYQKKTGQVPSDALIFLIWKTSNLKEQLP